MDEARRPAPGEPYAYVAGRLATDLVDVSHDPTDLDGSGYWAVVGTFEGSWTFARFARIEPGAPPESSRPWQGVDVAAWRSSLDETQYRAGVSDVRDRIAAGDVYQVNLCRVLSAPLPSSADLASLADILQDGNPAPYAARVYVPSVGVDVVSASPELFLRRDGKDIASSPIKGTGRAADDLTAKDVAENVMIVDLVRNDLGRVAATGSVVVEDVLSVEPHPGLVHLVSTVRGRLLDTATWSQILDATFPPGSVSGAPKSSALRAIRDLEPVGRGPYCGAIGWVDADTRRAELAVGIRTFWRDAETLRFGTGAGITWGSDPSGEWHETELKARRLLGLTQPNGRRS